MHHTWRLFAGACAALLPPMIPPAAAGTLHFAPNPTAAVEICEASPGDVTIEQATQNAAMGNTNALQRSHALLSAPLFSSGGLNSAGQPHTSPPLHDHPPSS
jgi:hypothetical protein